MSEQSAIQFVPVSPVACSTDPTTSHESARRVTRDGTRKRQAEAVLAALITCNRWWGHPSTSAEIAACERLDRHLVARRLPELADPQNGALVERGEPRECRITGRRALTWRARP